MFFFFGCTLISWCCSDPAEGAFCQDFTQNHGHIQAGTACGDRYQRLPFLLPDCMFVQRSLPSELEISVWQRKKSYCHRWLQRDQQEKIFKTGRLFESLKHFTIFFFFLRPIIWTWNDLECYQLTHRLECFFKSLLLLFLALTQSPWPEMSHKTCCYSVSCEFSHRIRFSWTQFPPR